VELPQMEGDVLKLSLSSERLEMMSPLDEINFHILLKKAASVDHTSETFLCFLNKRVKMKDLGTQRI